MQYVRFDNIAADSKEIPDGEIFVVHTNDRTWAFAMRINGEFTLSQFEKDNAGFKKIKKLRNQVMYAKENGWSRTKETALDDVEWKMKPLYRCLYCGAETVLVDGPCKCRGKSTGVLNDFLLPSDW